MRLVIIMYIFRVQCNWLQKAGSAITGPVVRYYNFFHFPTPIEIEVDGRRFQTQPNACIFSAPMQPRGFYFAKDTTMNWVHAKVEISELLEQYEIPLNCVFYPADPGFIPDLFRKIMLENHSSDPYKADMMECYSREFVIHLSRAIRGKVLPEISSAEQKKMYRLRWQIVSDPEKRWTVEEMAAMASLSVSRFHAVYKLMFNSSPMKDVIKAKIDRAKSLLLMDEKPTLSEVSERLGYKSQQHFIVQFKAVTGMTPGAYRKANR